MTKNSKQMDEKRPPVVVVLGHVDHGKTSLLDFIRKTNVAQGESGGITQHIGAYQVSIKHDNQNRLLTFIDTPGHAAFHQMRSRGATVADIAVLVVAADDGVQPQTKEAVEHIHEAGIPFIVAINKIDKSGANPSAAKAGLADLAVTVESFGGDISDVEISATKGTGISDLLDLLVLTTDLQDLTADASQPASGVVIEAELDRQRGALATLLVRRGTLRIGDDIATPSTRGTVRMLEDFRGNEINEAPPATPTRILGLSDVPVVGERFSVITSEDDYAKLRSGANQLAPKRHRIAESAAGLPLILKADANGTLEALAEMLENIKSQDYAVVIVGRNVGSVSDNDIKTAEAAGGIVVAFRVSIDPLAKRRAKERDITIVHHDVIYELVERTKKILEASLDVNTRQEELGRLKVLAVFRDDKKRGIIGGRVIDGTIKKRSSFDIEREKKIVGAGTILTLQHNKNDVDEVSKGKECGLRIETNEKIQEGDILVAHHEVKTRATLNNA